MKKIKVTPKTWGKDLTLVGGPYDGEIVFAPESADTMEKEGHFYNRMVVAFRVEGERVEIPVFIYTKDDLVSQTNNIKKFTWNFMQEIAKKAGISEMKIRDHNTGKDIQYEDIL